MHRDIKPSNIMLESDAAGAPVVKVIDYGIAKSPAP
jgi:serine/threonine protein kinase